MVKRILMTVLVFVLGMIVGVVALFGGLYAFLSNAKLGQIGGLFGFGDMIGDEIKDKTVMQTVELFSSKDTTFGEYCEYFPGIEREVENINNGDIGKFIYISVDALKNESLNSLGTAMGNAISIVVSFDELGRQFGVTLPDLPLFKTEANGGSKDYIQITSSESTEIKNRYYENKKADIYYLDGENYLSAYNGDSLKSSAVAPLYYYGTLVEVPVTDAVSKLSGVMDFENLTVKELEVKFGFNIRGDEDSLIAKIIDENDTVSDALGSIEQKVKTVSIGDLGISFSGIAGKLLNETDTIQSLSEGDVFTDRIDNLMLEDIMGDDYGSAQNPRNLVIDALIEKNATVGELNSIVADLVLTDIYETPDIFVEGTHADYLQYTYDAQTGTYTEVASGGTHMLSKEAHAWFFLLYEKTEVSGTVVYEPIDIKVIDFGAAINDTISHRFETATIEELFEVGLIAEKPNAYIKDMTISQIIALQNS